MFGRHARLVVAAVAAVAAFTGPSHAAEGGTLVGGANADPAALISAGHHTYEGAFTVTGSVGNNPFLATDCQFTADEESPDGVSARGTITAHGCAGDDLDATLTYDRTAGVLTGSGTGTFNDVTRGGITITCVIYGPTAYVSVRYPPLSAFVYIGFGFSCTIVIQIP